MPSADLVLVERDDVARARFADTHARVGIPGVFDRGRTHNAGDQKP